MLTEWIISKLDNVRTQPRVLVRDPLGLLRESIGEVSRFARKNDYTVIVAATNLAFRDLYENAVSDPEVEKLLVIDRTPASRRKHKPASAPPVFYPDLLAVVCPEANIQLDLRQFLREKTNDSNWPASTNNPRYARIIVRHLVDILKAHQNLRKVHDLRFTDVDFKKIVAFAALGVADAAFKWLKAEDYWKIALLHYSTLDELESMAPDITVMIRDELKKAPAPFCWLLCKDIDTVLRAFYLSVILSQHQSNWNLLLANIDPALAPFSGIKTEIIEDSMPGLLAMDPEQARRDMERAEQSLDRDALKFILLDQLQITKPEGFSRLLENEHYSQLFRSLALLEAIDDILTTDPSQSMHKRLDELIYLEKSTGDQSFVDTFQTVTWTHLKQAYRIALDIVPLRRDLASLIKSLKVMNHEELSYRFFWDYWNGKRINRLEYYLSFLERLVDSGKLLPRPEGELPSEFGNALRRIRDKVKSINTLVFQQLKEINSRYQDMIAFCYHDWTVKDGNVYLTSHFLNRCLKPYWDPLREKAVVMLFDGMRYDIWDELLKPALAERLEIVTEYHASSLLPSETHVSRKAISAGLFPDQFNPRAGEDRLLKDALVREFNFTGDVEVVPPEGLGTGENVHYRAGNLEVYIFELCDKELHNINMKVLPDGRTVPSRPLSFIYRQHLKNIIDNEVMSIIQGLIPDTKVFITADHGFGPVGREPLWFALEDMNELQDCTYLNCMLKVPFSQANLPEKVRNNVVAFTPEQLRMPRDEKRLIQKTGQIFQKNYQAILFPRVGYSFSRQASHYNPDAYSHGGISLQEMIIPMVVLQVRSMENDLLSVGKITGPQEVVEGEEAEFRINIRMNRVVGGTYELQVNAEGCSGPDPERDSLPQQVKYVTEKGADIVFRFVPNTENATIEERRCGMVKRTLSVTISYKEGYRMVIRSLSHQLIVRFSPDRIIRRVPAHLGNILGLTPKSMR